MLSTNRSTLLEIHTHDRGEIIITQCANTCHAFENNLKLGVYLGVRTCAVFRCFLTIMLVLSIVLTSLFSLFYVTRERNRFLH